MNRQNSVEEQMNLVLDFNDRFPVGTTFCYWKGLRHAGPGYIARTRSIAHLLGGHTAVVWFENESGCIALSHVEVVASA